MTPRGSAPWPWAAGRIGLSESQQHESMSARLHRTLGPLAGGLVLDFVDLATFGPIGVYGGFMVAGAVGWWLGTIYEFPKQQRIVIAALSALYGAIPFTEPLPIATGISALARFRDRRRSGSEPDHDSDDAL